MPGSNLLAAARKLGIDVPALCYHPACTPNTSCMACVMKVTATGSIVPSCATPAEDGLVVESETPEVRALRRTALELLLSDHAGARRLSADDPTPVDEWQDCTQPPLTCACEKHPYCRLRKYAQAYGADPARFRGQQRAIAPRTYDHPEITYEPAKCILCGICVQLTQQAGEPLGLTMIGRGFDVRVDVPLNGVLAEAVKKTARRVAGACPTGALTVRRITRSGGPVDADGPDSPSRAAARDAQ